MKHIKKFLICCLGCLIGLCMFIGKNSFSLFCPSKKFFLQFSENFFKTPSKGLIFLSNYIKMEYGK